MKIHGTITLSPIAPAALTQVLDPGTDLVVVSTLDNPPNKIVRVEVNTGLALDISGAEYDALSAQWASDDDLLRFIAKKFNLTIE